MLEQYTMNLPKLLLAEFKPYPSIDNREIWDHINPSITAPVIKKADEFLDFTFIALPASIWLDFTRTGNRANYQKISSERKLALNNLLVAELLTNKGTYLDKIIDVAWMMLEETTWIIPAHNLISGYKKHRNSLPDVENPIIDLMSAEVGVQLALVKYFLKDQLNAVSPLIVQRIDRELEIRLLTPYHNRTDYWWMGFMADPTERLNNWNPWINSNILMITLLNESDYYKKINIIQKMMRSFNEYLLDHPDDGCCDEGPGYWARAGASAFECLKILKQATNGKIDLFDNKKIKAIGNYILNAHIGEDYFTNFADASAKLVASPVLIYDFGKSSGNENLMKFGSYLLSEVSNISPLTSSGFFRSLTYILTYDEVKNYSNDFKPCAEHFYKDTQVFIKQGSEVFFSAKGGTNRENHNHNDIGTYMIYKNQKPLLIDVGSMEYTRKTFSPQRYEIWTNQSGYHNNIMIDQIMQNDGYDYKATEISYDKNEQNSNFSLNMEKAYINDNIISLRRSFTFDNIKEDITISDTINLQEKSNDITYTFMAAKEPVAVKERVVFTNKDEKMSLSFNVPVKINIEKMHIDDIKLKIAWASSIYRVTVTLKDEFKSGVITHAFRNN